MKKIIIIGAAMVAVMLVAVVVWGTGFGATPYYETETEFGMWQDELYVVFEDGSESSLKIIEENMDKPFTVSYGGKAITYMGIKITAAISGSGFTGAELKFIDFGVKREIDTTGYVVTKKTYNAMRTDGTIQVVMGKTQSILTTGFNLDTEINQNPTKYPAGNYRVWFKPLGTVKYRGYPDGGSWVSATLPPNRTATIQVTHTPSGSIIVTLGSGIT